MPITGNVPLWAMFLKVRHHLIKKFQAEEKSDTEICRILSMDPMQVTLIGMSNPDDILLLPRIDVEAHYVRTISKLGRLVMGQSQSKRPQHLEFRNEGLSLSGKTVIVTVWNTLHNVNIGKIHWHGAWRKYVYRPSPDTIYDAGCQRAIAKQLSLMMRERNVKEKL